MEQRAKREKKSSIRLGPTLQLTVYDGPARVGGLWEPEARRGDVSGLVVLEYSAFGGGKVIGCFVLGRRAC
jgi:hypothetical protein